MLVPQVSFVASPEARARCWLMNVTLGFVPFGGKVKLWDVALCRESGALLELVGFTQIFAECSSLRE